MSAALTLEGPLDETALRRGLTEITHRHEVLRTTFEVLNGEPKQVVHEAVEFQMPTVLLNEDSEEACLSRAREMAQEEARLPFLLDREQLLRVKLLRISSVQHVLLVTMHHIVSDGWSIGVLTRELAALYESYRTGSEATLAPLPVQYSDFARWQREWLSGEVLERQLGYWRKQLADAPPILALPTDRPRRGERTGLSLIHI